MFDKFEAKCQVNWKSAYAQNDWKQRQHHERRRRFVESMKLALVCMECGGRGGEIEAVYWEYGNPIGPWCACGFCEGTGLMTPWERGQWLRWKKEEKRRKSA